MQEIDTAKKTKNKDIKSNAIDTKAPQDQAKNTPENHKKDSITKRFYNKFLAKKWQKALLFITIIILIILSATGVVAYKTYQIAMTLKTQTFESKAIASQAFGAFKTQNLPEAESQLNSLKDKLENIKQTYEQLSFYQNVPWVKDYYVDGQHGIKAAEAGLEAGIKTISTIVPYSDVLGFQGEGSFTGGTAEDRIRLLLETLQKVMPEFDTITENLQTVQSELAAIDANRYPEMIQDQPVRQYLTQAQDISNGAVTALVEFRPVLEQLPSIAGGNGERKKYLILFQNDNELRPTGGFLTAYSVIYLENGKVAPEKSDDIYEIDKKFNKKIPIPEKLGKYLTTEKYWNLRDMNISPDFKTSMDVFFENYQTVKGEPDNIDGIISVDTQLLISLLKVLGPVEVPGYGTFSAENDPHCDCPQIVYALSEIITRPTPYLRDDRKGILGPMMQAILQKTYSANKAQWPQLFQIGWQSIEGKHVQLYFLDEKHQAAAEAVNAAGRMNPQESNDFLAIINSNLGGAKSNLFVTYEVNQVVSEPEDGFITKTVEITYKNPRKADNCNLEAGLLCLNSTLNDWTRLYIPKGSELIKAQGFKSDPETYEEDGFSVIDGYFTLEPLGSAKIKITYKVPYTDENIYRIYLWKQGGLDPIKSILDVNGGQEEVLYDKDTLYETAF